MRSILWFVGLLTLLGGLLTAGCEATYVRARPYYYYYGEPEPYIYFEGHRGERHEGIEHHERGEYHAGHIDVGHGGHRR